MSQAGPADNRHIVHKNNTVSVLEERHYLKANSLFTHCTLIIFLTLFQVYFMTLDALNPKSHEYYDVTRRSSALSGCVT